MAEGQSQADDATVQKGCGHVLVQGTQHQISQLKLHHLAYMQANISKKAKGCPGLIFSINLLYPMDIAGRIASKYSTVCSPIRTTFLNMGTYLQHKNPLYLLPIHH